MQQDAAAKPQKCYSTDGENYHHELDSLSLEVGDTYYEADVVEPNVSELTSGACDNLIDTIANAAFDEAGEHSDSFVDELQAKAPELHKVITDWIVTNVPPRFFTAANVVEKIATEEDVT